MTESTSLHRSVSGAWDDPDAPKNIQPTSTTLVEYISETFGCVDFSYSPGDKIINVYDDSACCGSSYNFNVEGAKRLYNFLGCFLDDNE